MFHCSEEHRFSWDPDLLGSMAPQFTGVTIGRSLSLSVEWVQSNELLYRVVGKMELVYVKCLEK